MPFGFKTLGAQNRAVERTLCLRRLVVKLPHRMTSLDYYVIEDLLTDGERAARDRARCFVREEVMPEVVPCHRAGKFPEHLTARMGVLRFFERIS